MCWGGFPPAHGECDLVVFLKVFFVLGEFFVDFLSFFFFLGGGRSRESFREQVLTQRGCTPKSFRELGLTQRGCTQKRFTEQGFTKESLTEENVQKQIQKTESQRRISHTKVTAKKVPHEKVSQADFAASQCHPLRLNPLRKSYRTVPGAAFPSTRSCFSMVRPAMLWKQWFWSENVSGTSSYQAPNLRLRSAEAPWRCVFNRYVSQRDFAASQCHPLRLNLIKTGIKWS